MVGFGVHHLPLPGAAPAAKKGGSLPPLPPPPVWRHDAPCEGVDTRCRHRTGLYSIGLRQSVPTRVQCGFPGTTWTTTARASPSESGALGLLKGRATSCATYARHPPFLSGPSIRRHVLDPRRRKSSIIGIPEHPGTPPAPISLSDTAGLAACGKIGMVGSLSGLVFAIRSGRIVPIPVPLSHGAPPRRARRGQRGRRRTA